MSISHNDENANTEETCAHNRTHIRYYVHGDQMENDAELFFCARCDLAQPLDHFFDDRHSRRENFIYHLARYIEMRDELTGEGVSFGRNGYYRPAQVYNLFSQHIRIQFMRGVR